jgi:hypothetical protein
VFGGGLNSNLSNFGARTDLDFQLLWEWRNLGFGNHALVRLRDTQSQLAELELLRIQDRVAAEVMQAYAQVQSAAERLRDAEVGLKDAVESVNKNVEGMKGTKPAGGAAPGATRFVLLIRPQEVVASVQALAQAYIDYYGAVADYDRAQFRLYRAAGQPAQWLNMSDCPTAALPDHSPPSEHEAGGLPLPCLNRTEGEGSLPLLKQDSPATDMPRPRWPGSVPREP